MKAEWIELPNGENLHSSTVDWRIHTLGWSANEATANGVQKYSKRDGAMNIAAAARADRVTPAKVQLLMRQYGVSYEDARDHVRKEPA